MGSIITQEEQENYDRHEKHCEGTNMRVVDVTSEEDQKVQMLCTVCNKIFDYGTRYSGDRL